ncbi:MAG: zinc ribbon domain-containing protein [Acidobacteria bacterium]|nr:zinc ribbon domain-containing protein [Acidobacteriota bacterium]
MPLYEYECAPCAHRFELIQKFSDPPVEICPACGGRVHKLLSSPAIQFKGSGWYITDYARKGSSAEPTKPAGGDKSPPSSDSASASSAASTADSTPKHS